MIKIVEYNQIVMTLFAGVFFSVSAIAQTAEEAPQQVEKIEVNAMRDPGMMPYKEAYAYLQKLNATPHDKIAVRMRIVSNDNKIPLQDIKIRLQGDKTLRPIPIGEEGLIDIPLEKALIDDNADFISNQKKGVLGVHVNVEVLLPASGTIRYRYLAEALEQARDSVKGMVPWYVRWFVPNNWNAVDVEFEKNTPGTATVLAANGKQVFRADNAGHLNMLLNDHLITENPEVVFSTPPKKIGAGMINEMMSYKAQKPE
jgi:hypothetical protein